MLGWWLGLTDLPSVTLPQGINTVGPSNVDLPGPFKPGMYELEIVLRKGNNLAIRDRRGTSDPYVKFKIAGKEVFRSKTIHKNLNPVWDEKVTLLVDSLKEPLYVKVFDYDFGLQDDFMGSSYLYLESLEHLRTLDVILELKDPQYPDHDLGSLELAVTLTPKEGSFKDAHQSLRLSDVHRKAQLWRGIVSISLIEGRNLQPMDANGLSDPYVKFRMGHQKYKSKTIHKTLNPQWREQFDFHLYDERGGVIDITLWDRDAGKRDDFMGRCQVDISLLSKECTHRLDLSLEEGEGTLALLVTLTASAAVSIADLSVNVLDDPRERKEILHRYACALHACTQQPVGSSCMRSSCMGQPGKELSSPLTLISQATLSPLQSLLRSFNNIKDVGIVQVKVIRAEGLMAADVTGKSDPFCVVELSNDRLQTHTVYKNLNPEWNKVFMFNVKDIHSVLEVTVYDEDRDRSADFLGKVSIPLLSIQNGERKAYALKSKEMTVPTKGVIFLEMDVIYNAVKAGLRTLIPIEQKYIEEEPRVSKQNGQSSRCGGQDERSGPRPVPRLQVLERGVTEPCLSPYQLLLRNFNRVRRCFMVLFNAACYVNSCFEWESPQRSICAFLLFVVVVWNFELYMVPLALLLPLAWNYALIASGKDVRQGDVQAVEDILVEEDEDYDRDDKDLNLFWSTRCRALAPSMTAVCRKAISSRIFWLPSTLSGFASWWGGGKTRVDPLKPLTQNPNLARHDSERKGFMNKLYAIQDVCISVQSALDEVASYGERIKNTFNWTVPFLSWLAIVALCVVTVIVYFIPLRYIVLAWGVNKFTKKLRDPYTIDNNELLDFFSRVPSDVQVVGTLLHLSISASPPLRETSVVPAAPTTLLRSKLCSRNRWCCLLSSVLCAGLSPCGAECLDHRGDSDLGPIACHISTDSFLPLMDPRQCDAFDLSGVVIPGPCPAFLSVTQPQVQYRELKLDPSHSPNKRKKNNPG
ncbi:hypothetical protein P4O66_012137 [Electrophorus voltai]|uniref:C2 domain-containing protein n=1 Tax=Electrophorus voltai TaxID=2609070 RepID=A0AAD8Z6C2_9TELE|nr:hypothetical protein P4O66_012137 [Electrophorus voltai]